jgi:hypothetical protein
MQSTRNELRQVAADFGEAIGDQLVKVTNLYGADAARRLLNAWERHTSAMTQEFGRIVESLEKGMS